MKVKPIQQEKKTQNTKINSQMNVVLQIIILYSDIYFSPIPLIITPLEVNT